MKPEELRIGNIFTQTNEPKDEIQIVSIGKQEVDSPTNGGDWVWYKYYNKENSTKYPSLICYIEPIPITEEWLERFGFNKSNGFWIDLQTHYLELISTIEDNGDVYYYPAYVEIGEFSSDPEQRVSLNRIQCIHELQNLIFILTGSQII
jgi:hypothetical protein